MVILLLTAAGVICIGISILHINAILACKTEITGIFIKYNTVHNGRGVTYEPVFRYYIEGEEFQGRCLNWMSLSNIQKKFTAGQTYMIYVNAKKPGYFVVYRKVQIQDIIVVLIGIGLILLVAVFI